MALALNLRRKLRLSNGTPTPTPATQNITLTRTSLAATNPPTFSATLPVETVVGDVVTMYWATSEDFTTGLVTGTPNTIDAGEAAAGTLTGVGPGSALGTGSPWWFKVVLSRSGSDLYYSNTKKWNDVTAPTISTSGTATVDELATLSIALTANETIELWDISGGDDAVQFEISGSTLRWFANGYQTYASPVDIGANNIYDVTVRATDLAGNTQTKAIAVTVAQIDQTANAFSFTDATGATPATLYTSDMITVAGLGSGVTVSGTVSGSGAEYQKNGGAWTAAGAITATNGDTFKVRNTSGAYSSIVNTVLNINGVSDTYSITAMADPSAISFTPVTSQPAAINTGGTASFTNVDFAAGYGVVYVYDLAASETVSSVTVGGTACTKVKQATGRESNVWVTNSTITAGTKTVAVAKSGGAAMDIFILAGSLSSGANTTPSSTNEKTSGFGFEPYSAGAVTIPTSGVGVAFFLLGGTGQAASTGTLVSTHPGGALFVTRETTAGSWTASMVNTEDTGSSSALVCAWGA